MYQRVEDRGVGKTGASKKDASHPQTDGQSERSNQTFEIGLRHWVAAHPDEPWTRAVPCLQMAFNSSEKKATRYTPHRLLYGIELRQPLSLLRLSRTVDDTLITRADAEQSLAFAAMSMKRYYDAKHKPMHFEPGDIVYVRLGHGYNIPVS